MYLDRFLNGRYITLFFYCIYLNKNNSAIVDLKYDKWNTILFLRRAYKKLQIKKFDNFLLTMRKNNKINGFKELVKKIFKNKIKQFIKKLAKARAPLKIKRFLKLQYIKLMKVKFNIFNKSNYRAIKKFYRSYRSYNFINVNVNLHKLYKKNKMLKYILNKLLKNQVLANASLLDGFLNLNLHALFLKRFKFRFFKYFERKKIFKHFNYNNFNLYFTSKVFPKLLNLGYLFLYVSKVKKLNNFYDLFYNNVSKKLLNFFTFNVNLKYFKKYKKYLLNIRYINYINISFKINAFGGRHRKRKHKTRKYLKRLKKKNLFLFFNLAFFKLFVFLFLYWFNKFIFLINNKNNGIMISTWFKSLGYFFKTYNWRRKLRHFYLSYNETNNFIFFNYKKSLLKVF